MREAAIWVNVIDVSVSFHEIHSQIILYVKKIYFAGF